VPTPDGAELNALLVLPADYEPGVRYPVLCSVYAGPSSPTVSNRWRGTRYLQDQMLAQKGYIVWYCDPRSASGESAASAWHAYQRLGEAELADIEAGVRWLIDQGYADPERIGIQGGSYGGYMVCYALTHSKMFKVGIAAFPVTDWRHYDTIYTERYMRTPANNPEGYRRSSALDAASSLHGRLLIYHGMMDDNVHMHNTLLFIDRLQRAGKQFDLMLYPLDRHGIGRGSRHEREMTLNYLLTHL
jgi:dipeptidyl-peptidase-4